jgi:hypothetical protein
MVEITSVSPVLLVADVHETAGYYRDVLGFFFDRIDGEPPSFVVVRRDNSRLMFRQPRDGAPQPPNASVTPAFPFDVFLYVDDVEALAVELRGRGAEVLGDPIHRPNWNGLELTVRDCNGRVLCFGQLMG